MSRGERLMVAPAEFRSYYGRPVLKPPVWEWKVPAYLFTGGLSAGCAVLAAGAELTERPALRRTTSVGGLGAVLASAGLLIADLGRPERFHHMLRVAKPTSPMSVGTWILAAYGPGIGVAAVRDLLPAALRRRLPAAVTRRVGRAALLSAAGLAPGLASYTAALLSQTAVPAWHDARRYLPFAFTGSAAASAGGLAMVLTPVAEAAPARAFACYGGVGELVAGELTERIGLAGESYRTGRARRLRRWSEVLTTVGVVGSALAGRDRGVAVVSGLALLAGSLAERFGVFEAGVASAKDPKYVVVPQRERLDQQAARR